MFNENFTILMKVRPSFLFDKANGINHKKFVLKL